MAKNPTPVNIRNFSVKCGRCGEYQVLVSYEPHDDWNLYNYECEWPPCSEDSHRSRTVLEVPGDLDEFAARDKEWHGGKVHAGADARAEDGASTAEGVASGEGRDIEPSGGAGETSRGGLLPVISGD